eukprot:1156729-Pelagomonas_calceolata.AAC.3
MGKDDASCSNFLFLYVNSIYPEATSTLGFLATMLAALREASGPHVQECSIILQPCNCCLGLSCHPVEADGWGGQMLLAACGSCRADYPWKPMGGESWLPVEADGWGGQMEASLSMGDWITNAAYFSVVSICAPIWEEVSSRSEFRMRGW